MTSDQTTPNQTRPDRDRLIGQTLPWAQRTQTLGTLTESTTFFQTSVSSTRNPDNIWRQKRQLLELL